MIKRVKPGYNSAQGWGDLPPLKFPPLLADPPRVKRLMMPFQEIFIACVCVGPKFPAHYVHRLQSMVERHLTFDHRFVCITDREDIANPFVDVAWPARQLPGWYSKINMFDPGIFPEGARVVYFDLDVIIIDSIDELVMATEPFCMIREFNAKPLAAHNSSVMAWDAGGEASEIFERFEDNWMRRSWGDQECIWTIMGNDRIWNWPDAWIRSYKYHCTQGPPSGTKVVVFHGDPKPDAVAHDWVERSWR